MPWYPGHKHNKKKHMSRGQGGLFMVGDEWKTLQQVADLAGVSLDNARIAMYYQGISAEKFIQLKRNGTD